VTYDISFDGAAPGSPHHPETILYVWEIASGKSSDAEERVLSIWYLFCNSNMTRVMTLKGYFDGGVAEQHPQKQGLKPSEIKNIRVVRQL